MTAQKFEIACPSCSHQFALDEIYTQKIQSQFQKQFESKNTELLQKQKQLLEEQDKLQKDRESLAEQVRERLKIERAQIENSAKQKAKEDLKLELSDLEKQLNDKSVKLDEANKRELEFRQKMREIEEKEKTLELEVQRRADEQSKSVSQNLKEEFESKLKLAQKEKELESESLRRKVEELTKKLEQGSQQLQGEVLEMVLEDSLKSLFPFDAIVPVPKGVNGADVIQTVNNSLGKSCGSIIWELKNTKNWSDGWIQKLKDDQRQTKSEFAILVTQTLPKDVKNFALIDGVWVSDLHSYVSLCTALRLNLIELYNARQANLGKNEKMEAIYLYLSGNEFKQRVQSIVEAFQNMKLDLDKEKTVFQKIWAKREKEIERVITGTVGMYGDLEGIIGNTLPRIEGLELDALPDAKIRANDDSPLQKASYSL